MKNTSKDAVCHASVQTVQLSSQKCIAIVKTKIELVSHDETCVVYDQYLVVHYHKRPVNVDFLCAFISHFYPKPQVKIAK